MTANSHYALVGGLLVGASLMILGQGVVWLIRSEWAERQAVKAERIIVAPEVQQELAAKPFWGHASVPFTASAIQASREQHVADALAKTEAASVPRLSSVAPVIPIQRDGGQR